jgi:site-specific DNA-cytosine methylase
LEKKGLPTEQRIEFVQTELANALTTVQKDNLVLEKEEYMAKKYRIRKLTEKECWRLMGYKDADYNKVAEVISACQRYKTAGNAIVKQVLMAIFLQMGIQGKKRWNDMSAEERQALVDSSLDFLGEKNAG